MSATEFKQFMAKVLGALVEMQHGLRSIFQDGRTLLESPRCTAPKAMTRWGRASGSDFPFGLSTTFRTYNQQACDTILGNLCLNDGQSLGSLFACPARCVLALHESAIQRHKGIRNAKMQGRKGRR